MRQIPISNKMYPVWIARRAIIEEVDEKAAALAYTPMRPRMMWPAVILAASRKDRVMGRTIILRVSTRTKNGLSQSGAPPGSRPAVKDVGAYSAPDSSRESQIVRPRGIVIIRWLENLKT